MKRLFLITLSAFAGVACCFAQPSLPPKCQASLPKILLDGLILSEKDANALNNSHDFGQSNISAKYWTAYSDRENNTTYMEPSASSAQCSALRFNETVRIAKIQNGFALVYVDPDQQTEYPLISPDAKCRGWVPMKKLLLWQSCLANEKGIYNKALLCVNVDKSDKETLNYGMGYRGPSKSSLSEQLTTDMNFYYIMKRENGMALLATQSKVDGQFSDQVLYCWVPEQSFVPWNQRSCLEPTWKQEDVKYFAAKGITADVYLSDKFKQDEKCSSIPFKLKESAQYDQYLYRMPGSLLRFPILDNTGESVYNMSTFSTMGGTTIIEETGGGPGAIQEKRLEQLSHINLAIVIDGTSSMEPYYPAVKEAIKSGIRYFSQNDKIKVGAVIYRDYADGEAGLAEVCPLTDVKNGIPRINNFLDSGGRYGIRSSANDKTQTEALYYGLNAALDKLGFRKEESNIILVVGDCGNDVNDTKCPSQADIISKIVAKNVQIMGFQVQNKNIRAFNLFNEQLLPIIRKSVLVKYEQMSASGKAAILTNYVRDSKGKHEGYDYRRDTTKMKSSVDLDFYIGSHRFADADVNNGKMNPEMLTKHMATSIMELSAAIQKQKDLIAKGVSIFKGGGDNGPIGIDIEVFRRMFGDKWVEMMLKSNSLMNFNGYAKKKDDSGRDFFKPIIFISVEEFDHLLKRLAPVKEVALNSNNKDRTHYIEAMKALVQSFAPGMSDGDMAKLTNEQIQEMIYGLHGVEGGMVKKHSLDDLSNQTVVSATEYMSIINDFGKKYDKLIRIRNNKSYKFVKAFNGAKYYWIPIEDLP